MDDNSITTSEALIALAKNRLILSEPFYGYIACFLKFIPNSSVSTMCVTQSGRVYYNPVWVNSNFTNTNSGAYVIAHEICHIILNHVERMQSRDSQIYNVAADVKVNYMLDNTSQYLRDKGPRFRVTHDTLYKLALPNLMLENAREFIVEKIYDILYAAKPALNIQSIIIDVFTDADITELEKQNQNSNATSGITVRLHGKKPLKNDTSKSKDSEGEIEDMSSQKSTGSSESSNSDLLQGDSSKNSNSESSDKEDVSKDKSDEAESDYDSDSANDSDSTSSKPEEPEWNSIINEALKITAQKQGLDVSNTIKKIIDKEVNQNFQVNWKTLITETIQGVIKNDESFTRPNRRFASRGLYFPSAIKKKAKIVYAIDTSGSMQGPLVQLAYDTLIDIIKYFEEIEVTVIECDDQIHRVFTVNKHDKLVIKPTAGGTDFQPVFTYSVEKLKDVKLLIYATDLFGVYPPLKDAKKYQFKTIWLQTLSKGSVDAMDDSVYVRFKPQFGSVTKITAKE